jgi:hypothetical protein
LARALKVYTELFEFDSGIRDDNKVYTILEIVREPEYVRGRY